MKPLIALAFLVVWNLRALDISHSFPNAVNLNERGRIAITPSPMVGLPCEGILRAVPWIWDRYIHRCADLYPLGHYTAVGIPQCGGSSRSRNDYAAMAFDS